MLRRMTLMTMIRMLTRIPSHGMFRIWKGLCGAEVAAGPARGSFQQGRFKWSPA